MQLSSATWPEVGALGGAGLLAIPIGSLEQHGPHLPLDTDTRIAAALATRLARARNDIVVAPAVPFGASGEHADFPGTLLVDHVVLANLLIELVRSARASFGGVVLISAHGGNQEGLSLVRVRCRGDGDSVMIWTARTRGGDAHAGRTETSLVLAIDPGVVRMDLSEAGCTDPLEVLLPRLRSEGVRPLSPNGVLGDPRGASAAEGEKLLRALTAELLLAVGRRWPCAESTS